MIIYILMVMILSIMMISIMMIYIMIINIMIIYIIVIYIMMIYIMIIYFMMVIIYIMMNLPDHLNGMVEGNVAGVAAARENPAESFHNSILYIFSFEICWWHAK